MARKTYVWLLLIFLWLPQTQLTALPTAFPQDESIPRNGCVIYNPNNVNISFLLRNKKDGRWSSAGQVLESRKAGTYIEKDYILLGSTPIPLSFKKKYHIIWDRGRNEWSIAPE